MKRPATLDLDALRIATPCPVSWDAMTGDARKRFCGQCRLHVYDVSALTREEATTLIRSSEGRVCLRLHRRADGRVVTKDCGRVRLALERRLRRIRTAAAALLAAVGFAGCARRDDATPASAGTTPPAGHPTMGDVADPSAVEPHATMVEVALPQAPPDVTTGRLVMPAPDPKAPAPAK